jgi:hypothetical protein
VQDVGEKSVAAAMENFRKEGGNPRRVVEWLAGGYEFMDRGRFVDGLSGNVDMLWPAPAQQAGNVQKLPDSMHLNRFLVGTFMLYEFTWHQDAVMDAVEFCIARAGGNGGAVSIYSTLLAKIAGDAFVVAAHMHAPLEAAEGKLSEKTKLASQKSARNALEKTLRMADGYQGDSREFLRIMSAVSSLSCRVEPCSDRERFGTGRLPMRCRDPYASFLRAMGNIMLLSAENPPVLGEFLGLAMDAQRMRRDDLFFSAVAIIGWADLLSPVENQRMVRDTLSALREANREYLLALEEGFLRQPGMLALVRHSQME